jgi:hypothetical protein
MPASKLHLMVSANGTASFCLFIDYRGHHRKGVTIYNATTNKTLVSMNKKCIFEHYREVRTIKKSIN